jgi:hypothetical protein
VGEGEADEGESGADSVFEVGILRRQKKEERKKGFALER